MGKEAMLKREDDAFLMLELRVRECERRIATSDGRTRVLEHALRVFLANCSNPATMRAAWAQLSPLIMESYANQRSGAASDYLEGLRQGLEFIGLQIDAAQEPTSTARR